MNCEIKKCLKNFTDIMSLCTEVHLTYICADIERKLFMYDLFTQRFCKVFLNAVMHNYVKEK